MYRMRTRRTRHLKYLLLVDHEEVTVVLDMCEYLDEHCRH